MEEMNNKAIFSAPIQGLTETAWRHFHHMIYGDDKLCVASDITGPQQSIVTLPLSKWAKRKYDYDKIPTIFLLNS